MFLLWDIGAAGKVFKPLRMEGGKEAMELVRKERNQRKCRKNLVLDYLQNMRP